MGLGSNGYGETVDSKKVWATTEYQNVVGYRADYILNMTTPDHDRYMSRLSPKTY